MVSRRSSQQKALNKGTPLSSLEFCELIQPVVNELDSNIEIGLIDDISLSSDLLTLEKDVNKVIESEASTGLKLNAAKCEIIMHHFSLTDFMEGFK